MMKKLLIIGLIGLILGSCSTRSGHLTGVLGRQVYYPEIPLGMVYIPSGSYIMGQNDQDVPFMHQTVAKTVSVQRSEEHTSELQSRPHLVCRLLLEKKK